MANMKNMNSALSTNQMTPGTQVNGATGNGGSQPPRNRIVAMRAHGGDRDVLAEHEQQVGRRAVFDHEAGDQLGLRLDQVERRPVGLGQRRDEEDHEHREQRQPVPAEQAALACPAPSTMADRLSEPTHSSTVMMTKPIETS